MCEDKRANTFGDIMSKKKINQSCRSVVNKKARFEYTICETIDAGIVLQGWEVKSIRSMRVQICDAHVIIKHGECWLIGCIITPLQSASSHIVPDLDRTRKLLLKRREISKFRGLVQRKHYTIIPLDMHWESGMVKVKVAVCQGKKQYDKRQVTKEREWGIQKQRMIKAHNICP